MTFNNYPPYYSQQSPERQPQPSYDLDERHDWVQYLRNMCQIMPDISALGWKGEDKGKIWNWKRDVNQGEVKYKDAITLAFPPSIFEFVVDFLQHEEGDVIPGVPYGVEEVWLAREKKTEQLGMAEDYSHLALVADGSIGIEIPESYLPTPRIFLQRDKRNVKMTSVGLWESSLDAPNGAINRLKMTFKQTLDDAGTDWEPGYKKRESIKISHSIEVKIDGNGMTELSIILMNGAWNGKGCDQTVEVKIAANGTRMIKLGGKDISQEMQLANAVWSDAIAVLNHLFFAAQEPATISPYGYPSGYQMGGTRLAPHMRPENIRDTMLKQFQSDMRE